MPITFTDLQSANEYIKQKEEEGIEAYYVKSGNNYRVYITGKLYDIHPKITKLKERETKEGWAAKYDPDKDEITLGRASPTRIILHELGHAKLGHAASKVSLRREANEEIEANIFAYKRQGRNIDYKVGLEAMKRISGKDDPKTIIYTIKSILEEKGIELPSEVEEYWIKEWMPGYFENYKYRKE